MFKLSFVSAVVLASSVFQGAAAPTYDAKFDLAQGSYTGVSTFSVDRKGVVTGRMSIAQPIGVEANLAGEVRNGVWTFEFPYEIAQQSCTGMIKGTGKVTADRKTVSGTATISGACVPEPTDANFSFTQQAKK